MAFREAKRLTIIFVYAGILLLFIAVFYFMSKTDPTCSDGKRNQGEEGIDCGGPCRPCPEVITLNSLEIGSSEWVHDVDDKYDVIISIKNPNDVYGAAFFKFRAVAVLAGGEEIQQKIWDTNFILPGEEKYLFVHGFKLSSEPEEIKIEVDDASFSWKRFENYEEPNFVINNSRYEEKGSGDVDFGAAMGTVINRSPIDFETVDVRVNLRNETGKLLAVNSQRMNTVGAEEFRDYIMVFPHAFPGSVEKVEVFVETNPFDSNNYIRVHGTPDIWDQTL